MWLQFLDAASDDGEKGDADDGDDDHQKEATEEEEEEKKIPRDGASRKNKNAIDNAALHTTANEPG